MWRLGQISGMLEGLAYMEGGVLTSDVTELLKGAVETLEKIANEIQQRCFMIEDESEE